MPVRKQMFRMEYQRMIESRQGRKQQYRVAAEGAGLALLRRLVRQSSDVADIGRGRVRLSRLPSLRALDSTECHLPDRIQSRPGQFGIKHYAAANATLVSNA